MDYKCEIYHQESQPTFSIRTRTAVSQLPQILGESYGKIIQYLVSLGEQPGGAPYVAYFNMDMQDLDIEIGFPTGSKLPGEGIIQSGEMPSGKYSSCLHTGPYSELAPAYQALNEFLSTQNLRPSGIAYEFYLNDPNEVTQEELKTLIVFPLLPE